MAEGPSVGSESSHPADAGGRGLKELGPLGDLSLSLGDPLWSGTGPRRRLSRGCPLPVPVRGCVPATPAGLAQLCDAGCSLPALPLSLLRAVYNFFPSACASGGTEGVKTFVGLRPIRTIPGKRRL